MSNAATPHFLVVVGADQSLDGGDTLFDSGGHPLMVAGLGQYYRRIARLLASSQILGSPGLGAGLGRYIGQPLTPQVEQDALARAQAAIESDALTSSIASLSISMPHQSQIQVSAQIILVGVPTGSGPVSLIWTVGV